MQQQEENSCADGNIEAPGGAEDTNERCADARTRRTDPSTTTSSSHGTNGCVDAWGRRLGIDERHHALGRALRWPLIVRAQSLRRWWP